MKQSNTIIDDCMHCGNNVSNQVRTVITCAIKPVGRPYRRICIGYVCEDCEEHAHLYSKEYIE